MCIIRLIRYSVMYKQTNTNFRLSCTQIFVHTIHRVLLLETKGKLFHDLYEAYGWMWRSIPSGCKGAPISLRNLQRFLGVVGHYREFRKNCSSCCAPRHKKKVKFKWGDDFQATPWENKWSWWAHGELLVSSPWPRWSRLQGPMITAQSWLG